MADKKSPKDRRTKQERSDLIRRVREHIRQKQRERALRNRGR